VSALPDCEVLEILIKIYFLPKPIVTDPAFPLTISGGSWLSTPTTTRGRNLRSRSGSSSPMAPDRWLIASCAWLVFPHWLECEAPQCRPGFLSHEILIFLLWKHSSPGSGPFFFCRQDISFSDVKGHLSFFSF
jgi:hypothetical protein